ncbi:MAG: glutathione S-transferase N-terminal domain-containing protein [Ottowia sp.]|nr:glutathione S-transferase N-terminal domain-containing protein [Ottowia sp.]
MKLFVSTASPFARLTLVSALAAGIDEMEISVVNPWANPVELESVNPFSQVPTLITDSGATLLDTVVIARRLLGNDFLKNDAEARTASYSIILMEQLVKYVSLSRDQPEGATMHPHIARAKNAITRALKRTPHLEPESDRFCHLALGVALDYLQLRAPDLYATLSEETQRAMRSFTARPWLRATAPEWLEEHMPTQLAELRAVQ